MKRVVRTLIAVAALTLTFGTVGGMERGTVGLLPGTLVSLVSIAVLYLVARASGYVYGQKK